MCKKPKLERLEIYRLIKSLGSGVHPLMPKELSFRYHVSKTVVYELLRGKYDLAHRGKKPLVI